MRILVAGRSGQVAKALSASADADLKIFCLGRPVLDIADRSTIDIAIAKIRPDVFINAAAYTAVDKAEDDPGNAFNANQVGAGNAAAATAAVGIPIIHISTDYVFSGVKPTAYTETDEVGPTSIYGRSKLLGEIAVAEANANHTILRTAWIYSAWGQNFLKTMLQLSETRGVINVVADQIGTPNYAPDIAHGIIGVARQLTARPGDCCLRGVFHMTAEGEASWADFAEEIFRLSASLGGVSARVERIETSAYPTPAKRPANSRLDSSFFHSTYGITLPKWQDGVLRCLQTLRQIKLA